MDDSEKPKDAPRKAASIFELFSTAEPLDYFYMFVGSIGALITGVSIPFFNVLFGKMLNALNKSPNSFEEQIAGISLAFVYVAIINLFSGFFQVVCWSTTGERQAQKLREKYVRAILSQEIGWFDTCNASELSTKVADLTGKIRDGMGRKVGDLLQYVAQFLSAMVVGFYLSYKLTLVLLASLPLIAAAGAFMINAITSATSQSMEQYAQAGGLATETLSAIRTVSALNAQPSAINKFRLFLLEAMNVGIKKGLNVGLGNGLVFGACFLTYALGFWYGGNLVADSLASHCDPSSIKDSANSCPTGGDVMAVFFTVIMGSMALGQLAPPLAAFSEALAAVVPILETIKRVPLIDGLSSDGEKPSEKPQGRIQLSEISFAYPSRPNLLVCKGYDLDIEPGTTVALVGASGSGKSTIINLLLRFYDPQSGQVMLDGKDIKALNTRWLRSQMGYVGQEPVLFAGTIADNILYGIDKDLLVEEAPASSGDVESQVAKTRDQILKDRVIEAAKLANAHEFIMSFPQGYETDVGSNGVAMSGGQKQRIAIARALIKRPAVLLLDEATSALDTASEKLVQQSIDALQQSKSQTTIVIAHRLSTIRNADKIAVVSEGKIAEIGKHDELFSRNGIYADLVRLQMSSMEDLDMETEEEDKLEQAKKDTEIKADSAVSSMTDSPAVVATIADSEASPEIDQKEEVVQATAIPTPTEVPAALTASPPPEKSVMSKIWSLILKHPLWAIAGLLGSATFGGVFPVWGLLLAKTQKMFYFTDPEKIRVRAKILAGYYVLMAFISLVSSTFQFWGIAQVGERVSLRLRSQMFEAILRREIGFFDLDENAIGALTTRLSDDSRTVHKATGEALAKQLQALCTLAIGVGIGFSASWKISLVVLATFPLNIVASAIQMQAIAGQQYDNDSESTTPDKSPAPKVDANGKTEKPTAVASGGAGTGGGPGGIISTAFTHMRTVSAFSMQYKVASDYSSLTRNVTQSRIGRSRQAGLGFGGSNTALFLTYALLFWYGSTLISANEIDFEDMMTSILCLMLGALGLGQAMTDLGDQKAGVAAAQRIFQLIQDGENCPIDGLSQEGVVPTEHAKGRIELKNIMFRYPTRPDVQVCKNYNLTIEPGEVVALVGPSGSGKSTIMSLLLRFYDPLSGSILLDGRDLKEYNVRWLRSQIGYVGQEPVLFSGSVSSNISKGRAGSEKLDLLSLEDAMKLSDDVQVQAGCCGAQKKISLPTNASAIEKDLKDSTAGDIEMASSTSVPEGIEDIVDACRLSNAHEFISRFPQGYETDVGEGSIMVSGGQKQRIAIARALIKRPAVLLLDEATSALDATSEKLVQESIDALQQSKSQTTIVIAHRLTTIRNADKIAVIEKGQVVELGKHEELLELNGLYAELWRKQTHGSPSSSSSSSSPSLQALEETPSE